ncbi:MAG TPA: histidine phosphatase family protein [Gaiellaceae bacterium]|nr:histidine phosphatase family protein [Gaiellaceae bacterium]
MRVFLVRHAEAAPGEPDELRRLTSAGRDAARALGERLAGEHPTAVVTSPLLRARETADLIARACTLEATADDNLAPGATADALRAAAADKGSTVVAVGHQPDCSEIVLELTGRDVSFPPAGVAELDL